MKLFDVFLFEDANERLRNDQRLAKLVAIHFRHDETIPAKLKFSLGPKPDQKAIMDEWLKLADKVNNDPTYGPLSPDKKFHDWLTKIYATGATAWEDINARAAEALYNLQALSRRNVLTQAQTDLNRYPNLSALERVVGRHQDVLRKLKDEKIIQDAIKDAREFILIDNEDYYVSVPLNKGAAIKLARSTGVFANWCTGAIGSNYYDHYCAVEGNAVSTRKGPLVVIINKKDPEDKIQVHSQSNQFKNKQDHEINRSEYGMKHPRLFEKIARQLALNASELQDAGKWDMLAEVNRFRKVFADAWALPHDYEDDEDEEEEMQEILDTEHALQTAWVAANPLPPEAADDREAYERHFARMPRIER